MSQHGCVRDTATGKTEATAHLRCGRRRCHRSAAPPASVENRPLNTGARGRRRISAFGEQGVAASNGPAGAPASPAPRSPPPRRPWTRCPCVTTIASASASMPKYGFSPLPVPDPCPPSGCSVVGQHARHRRIGAARGGDHDADTVVPHHRRKLAGQSRTATAASRRTGHCCRPPAPRPAAAVRCASRGARPPPAAARRAGVTRCSAVPRHHDVRSRQLVMSVHHNQVEPARVHARMLHLHNRPVAPAQRGAAPPPPCPRSRSASSGNGARTASGTAASGDGHSDAVDPLPWRTRRQDAHLRLQPGRLGQSQGLRLQPGIALAQNP